jgi:exopolyphosphatase/guanosine-5'-triphosphate,3'-diphosphate pyrophosphatase
MAIEGMIEMRVDMIVCACCLIRTVLGRHHFEAIRVSSWSLKEGALYTIAWHGLT